MLGQGARSRKCVGPARSDGGDAVVGLDHVAITGKQKRGFRVRDNQQRVEMAQRSVCAPFLRELDCSAREVAMVLLQLVLEARKKRKRVRRATGEYGDNLVVVEATGLFRVVLDHAFTESHLPIT